MWLDSRGRLLGKLNLLDLLVCFFLLSLGGVVAYAVGVSRYQALAIVNVEPKRIVVVGGARQFVVVKGTGFDSGTTVWLGDYISRSGVCWDESTLGIEINEEIEPGVYPFRLRDGRGRTVKAPDPLEIIWEPKISEVKPKIIYSSGPGARLDIAGNYFSPSCTVRLGDREVPAERSSQARSRRLSADFSQGPPLPLGRHRLTVTNAGGQSVTWEDPVTVVPPPEVTSVTPDRILLGDAVDLVLHGKHFQEGTIVWLEAGELEPIGEATWVSSECLKIRLKTTPKMSGRSSDVILELRDGPKTKAGDDLVYVNSSYQVFMVATVLLDEQSVGAVEEFRDSLEWKLRRPLGQVRAPSLKRNYNMDPYPIMEVLLPTQVNIEEGTFSPVARSHPLRQGMRVWFNVDGHDLAGIVISKPYAVFSDDYFENKRTK